MVQGIWVGSVIDVRAWGARCSLASPRGGSVPGSSRAC